MKGTFLLVKCVSICLQFSVLGMYQHSRIKQENGFLTDNIDIN